MQSTFADTRPLDGASAPVIPDRFAPARAGVADLRAAVAGHVIPRLHEALRSGMVGATILPGSEAFGGVEAVRAFAGRMLGGDLDGARRHIERLRAAGQTLESVFLDLLAPTARHLRDLWSDDACGLADIAVALSDLHALLRRYAPRFGAGRLDTGRRALVLAPAPPSEVDVGLPFFEATMLSLFYRRDGWQARIECDLARPAVGAAIAGEWFDVIEILVPRDDQIAAAESTIRMIRRTAPNAAVGVIACGPARPSGADMTAVDPLSSLAQAERWSVGPARRSVRGASGPSPRHRLS